MIFRFIRRAPLFLTAFVLSGSPLFCAQKNPRDLKPLHRTSWNLEGGAFFVTDGRIPNGPCFRVHGQVDAPHFFDNLKRIDDDGGTTFRRGAEAVKEFPAQLGISMTIHDLPCSMKIGEKAP